jgi:hypothetical protein
MEAVSPGGMEHGMMATTAANGFVCMECDSEKGLRGV